ncbi:MAG: hypothetical protein ACFUZC_05995 [Chthoniobacteraceae bacterium]
MKTFAIILWIGIATFSNAQVLTVPDVSSPTTAIESPTLPPSKKTVPPGVFFVLERLSTVSDSGVASVMPGTRVTLVKAGTLLTVSDGEHQFQAYPYQLSNDPEVGQQLKDLTAAAKAKAAEELIRANKEYAERQRPPADSSQGNEDAIVPFNSSKQQDNLTPAQRAEKEKAERLKKIQALRQRIKDLRQEILDARPDRGYRGKIYHLQAHDTQRLIDKNQREIARIKEEIISLGGAASLD